MTSLREYLRSWKKLLRLKDRPPSLPPSVCESEVLARFLLESSKFSRTANNVKARAFHPPPDRKLAVYRTLGLSNSTIAELGNQEVAELAGKTLYGWGNLICSEVLEIHDGCLSVEPDNVPPKHANIVGWPDEKSEVLLIAQELAQKAMLHLVA